jgi:hypothetical protein
MNKLLTIAAVMGLVGGFVSTAAAQAPPPVRPERGARPIETFNGVAIHMASGKSGAVTINVTRWSTDEERQRLLDILRESGQRAMIADLQTLPQVGSIRLPNTMGVGLFYARSNTLPDGTRQVVLGTARAIGMAANAPQRSRYDATVIEIHFPPGGGNGEGKIVLAGRVNVGKDGQVQISNWQGEPVRLRNVRATVPANVTPSAPAS